MRVPATYAIVNLLYDNENLIVKFIHHLNSSEQLHLNMQTRRP